VREAPRPRPSNELALRVASAVVMVPFGIGVVWGGGWWLAAACVGIGCALNWELQRLIAPTADLRVRTLLVWVMCAGLVVLTRFVSLPVVLLWVGAGGALLAALSGACGRPGLAGLGFVAATVPPVVFLAMRDASGGMGLLLALFLLVWATDIAAYFAGRGFGGPRLSPAQSPNKTWAGGVGAVLCAGLAGAAVGGVMDNAPWPWVWLGVATSVVAQAGDLFESQIKRWAGVKDASRLIPGHGGVLDRLDSLMAASLFWALLWVAAPADWPPFWAGQG